MSQVHPGALWRCSLIKAIIVGIMMKRCLWGQKVGFPLPLPHTSPSCYNYRHIKGLGPCGKWAMSAEKRVPRQDQCIEHINPACSSYSFFPWNLQSHGSLEDVTEQPSLCLPIESPTGLVWRTKLILHHPTLTMWPNLLERLKVFPLISLCTKAPPIFTETHLLINLAAP